MMKDCCHYHPLKAATFACDHCHTHLCDTCTDDTRGRGDERCLHCAGKLDSLGASNSAEPFWRRLQHAFRYPLTVQTLVLIVGVSLLTAALAYLPFSFAIYLIATGAMMRYSFACLEHTANGKMTAPDITVAYEGGVALLFQLLALIVIMATAVYGVHALLGLGMAKFVGVLLVLSFPAVIILFALNQSLLSAVNPLNILQLIIAIGLPYGVLLGLMMVMLASVSVLHEVIGGLSFVDSFLQGIVSNFYTVVAFHIMGYMIFQYQAELGFITRADDDDTQSRPQQSLHNARIDIALKEGEYDAVVDLFAEANRKFPQEPNYYFRCFEFLCNVKLPERLARFAPHYFDFLFNSERKQQVYPTYKRLLLSLPGYKPDSARLRHLLAEQCHANGDPRSALRLLNGLHKHAPDYPRLVAAYELMCEALADLPGMDAQRAQCEKLVAQLKHKAAQRKPLNASEKARQARATAPAEQTKSSHADGAEAATNGELPPIEFKL
jgi:hypothetical protein